jgi:hypothetical protein
VSGPVAPSRDDPVVRALCEVVGGPAGRHAGHHPWWTPVRVALAVTAVVLAVGLLAKVPCADASARGADRAQSTLCHSDLARTYVAGGLAELVRPWTEDEADRARYDAPDLAAIPGYWALAAAHLTHRITGAPPVSERYGSPVDEVAERDDVRREAEVFTAVNAVGLAALGLLGAWLLAGVSRASSTAGPWAGMAWAASPVLLLAWPVGWDLLAAVAVAAVLWAHARGRPVLTGVAAGLGAAVVPHVALLLVAVVVVEVVRSRRDDAGPRPPGGSTAFVTTVLVAAGLVWALVDVPAWAAGPTDWGRAWAGALGEGPDLGSAWLVAEQAVDGSTPTRLLVAVCAGFVLVAVAGVGWWGLRARRTPTLAEVGLLLMVALLVVAPAYPVTHALLLLPLAAVAAPRWRDLLVWQSGEVFHLALTGFYVGGALAPTGGGDSPFYWLAVVVRIAAQVWLVAAVVHEVGVGRHAVERARETVR